MTSRGPFRPKTFYDSMIILGGVCMCTNMNAHAHTWTHGIFLIVNLALFGAASWGCTAQGKLCPQVTVNNN